MCWGIVNDASQRAQKAPLPVNQLEGKDLKFNLIIDFLRNKRYHFWYIN